MIRKVFTGVALAGALTLGTVGTASAAVGGSGSTASSAQSHAKLCATRAPKALLRIETFNLRYQKWLPKAQARLAADLQANNQGLAKAVQARMDKLKAKEAKLAVRQKKIDSLCPGVVAPPTPTTTTTGG